jgi:serine kinase of HPr protein (carbohydrate metabolism regulator)
VKTRFDRRQFLLSAGSFSLASSAQAQNGSPETVEELQIRVENNSVPELCAEKDNIEVDFIIHLEKWDDHKQYERVGIEDDITEKILGLDIPKLIIPVRDGRNIAVLVESAVTNFNLKQRGINSAKEFEKRVYDFIKNQNEE